tara:strand:- start:108 stop:356 length:249 start_codon:yes stop_codon:yes gene_type:complete
MISDPTYANVDADALVSQGEWEGVPRLSFEEIQAGVDAFWNKNKLAIDDDGKPYRTDEPRKRPVADFVKMDFVKPQNNKRKD